MRRLKRSWWLILILVIGLGIVGQVQAQGGWFQWVQGVVKTIRQTTHALSAWLKGAEEQPVAQNEERASASQTTAPPPMVPQREIPQSASSRFPSDSEESWFERLFETIPSSEGMVPAESSSEASWGGSEFPDVPSETSQEFDASESAEWEWFTELLAPPVPSYWDWDEEEWLKALLGDQEEIPLRAEQLQDRILEEIRRESEAVQEQWNLLQQLEALERAYSEGDVPSSSGENAEVNE